MLWEILLNIALFIPLGLLMAMMYTSIYWVKVLLFGIMLSSTIEISQYVFMKVLCEADDIIDNTLGVLIGYALFKAIVCSIRKIRDQLL